LPNILIKLYAILVPRPVIINPLAIKNARPINQMVEFPKPLKALTIDFVGSPGAKTCVTAQSVIPIIAIVPIEAAFEMIPTMVATKIARRCQAFGWTPSGAGMNQIASPITQVIRPDLKLISFIIFVF
jgi:hypothetical protein